MKKKCYEDLIKNLTIKYEENTEPAIDEERRARYKADIEDVFTPDAGARISRNREGCIMNTQCPTIGDVRREYGYQMAFRWLFIHITDAASKVSAQQRPGKSQIDGIAVQMMEQYFYLKLTEIMLFFDMFKRGVLGDVYNAFDSRSVFRAMKAFNVLRGDVIKSSEEKEHMEELRRDMDKRVTWEQYCKMKGISPKDDPITRLLRKINENKNKGNNR